MGARAPASGAPPRTLLPPLLLLLSAAATTRTGALPVDGGPAEEQTIGWPVLTSTAADVAVTRDPRVLNFFPVPIDDECPANDERRSGVCLNTYECRIQGGQSFGPCAMGLGVCCVFTATCGGRVFNNVTYFTSPKFPALHRADAACELEVERIAPEISQLRLDFVHFHLVLEKNV